MSSERTGPQHGAERAPGTWVALLFVLLFCYYWISLTPFVDLTGLGVADPSAGNSNALNQLVSFGAMAATGAFLYGVRPAVPLFQPRWLLVALIVWCVLSAVLAVHPDLAIKRVILVVFICVQAQVALLLPRSDREFAMLAGGSVLLVIALCYFGVAMLPSRSIHQGSEILEPMNAGLWRGLFAHKNTAAAAMILSIFFGLYAMKVWSRLFGLLIIVPALFFLFQTGGKAAAATLPAILLLAFVVEKWRITRVPLVVGGLSLLHIVVVGAALLPSINEFVRALGIDPTFTNRSDIWRFAFSAIAERPLTGYGLQSFWQTPDLVYSGGSVETWAVAAYNGHNSYIDTLLALGLPGLILTLVWFVFVPLRDIGEAQQSGNSPATTRLFIRIWLYVLFASCWETIFFEGGGSVAFCLLLSVFGLRLQARARLAEAPARRIRTEFVHA